MNVFILSTGRCGSMTVTRAFAHATNFTSGHETRTDLLEKRLEYPDDHIESDNRLAWFLGSLDRKYGERAHWVHLTRDAEGVADSYWRRWEELIALRRPVPLLLRSPRWFREWVKDPTSRLRPTITVAFAYGIVQSRQPLDAHQRREACVRYVETVNENITVFLEDKPNVQRIALEDVHNGFQAVWDAIGAQGNLAGALAELDVRHNAG